MYNQNNYTVDILVNGNKCKQHQHENRFYIEAKDGSEYEIKIENNSSNRVLAVVSVDSLDVLTGKTADTNAGGYIIGAWSSYRIKGYRYSNDTVGAFKFVKKDDSYAATKGKKSKKNCGVIGVILYEEKQTLNWYQTSALEFEKQSHPKAVPYWFDHKMNSTWSTPLKSNSEATYGSSVNNFMVNCKLNDYSDTHLESPCCDMMGFAEIPQTREVKAKGFDMGSGWGEAKDSKVVDVEFERGSIVFTNEIYYASRESLIEMGVPLKQEGRVNLPKSFPNGFAKPPANWKG